MPALLRNLIARAPATNDLDAVTALVMACDAADYGLSEDTREEVHSDWQRPGFNLKTDAWVIVTTSGQFVGYAYVWHSEQACIQMFACVHPTYRGRGIGTLLLRLAEARAREQAEQAPPGVRVTLGSTVSNVNAAARHLFEWEGYTLARHLWRLVIKMDEVPSKTFEELYQHGKLKVDLVVDAQNLMDATQLHQRTGMYVARQYDIYEKVLHIGLELPASTVGRDLSPDSAGAAV
jgi:ribosomal protein S18 acetylase RimI-like enzyme